tara:strand:+ start:333 stop:860 length:528 start_codon:yes stop_codon:yes gene_type:complete
MKKQSPTKLGMGLGKAMQKNMPSVTKMKKESPTKFVSAVIAGIAKVGKIAGKVAKVASKAGKVGKAIGKGAKTVSKVAGKIGTAAKTAKGAKIVKTADSVTRGLQGAYMASGGTRAGKGSKTNVAAGMKKINFGGKASPFTMKQTKSTFDFGNKKSPAKAGQTAGQIVRRERLMT